MAAAVKGSRAGNALFSGRSTERRGSLEVRVDGKLASEVGGGGLLVIGNVEFLVPVDDFNGADRNGTLAVSSLSSPGGAFDVVGFVGADPGGWGPRQHCTHTPWPLFLVWCCGQPERSC